jgi:type VI secretion system secreted protein VgrG
MAIDHFTLGLPELTAELQVTGAVGNEAMNALYRFDVDALVSADPGFARRAIETPATLWMHFDNVPVRAVHGIVGACEATGQEEHGRPIFQLRLVPRLARLQHRRTSRIFQDLTTREIVEQVLAISYIPNRWDLAQALPKRTYCVQYDETDYAFVTRICAADGIFFSFDHPIDASSTEEILVLADHVAAYTPLAGSFRFRPTVGGAGAMTSEENHLQDFRVRHSMTTKRVLLRRFDFEKPPIPRRDAAGLDEALNTNDRDAMRAYVDRGATVYEHQQTREQALLEPIAAQTALEAETAEGAVVEAETAGRRLLPGHRFRLVEHTLPELDGEYVITSCAHECHSPQWAGSQPIFRNRFTAVPASVPYRAARPRRQVRQSIETATVVGPRGQEIYTDELGRVKVQFHWDLQGEFNEKSSAWLRVTQAWAGTCYGAQFLPRVGHEVLVGYIDGDADRPVVLGSLHNGVNQAPFQFPDDRTRSGIKTWTSPDGQGGHELMFEDRAGVESVALRSNRTMNLSAAEDSTLSAERNLRITAGADRTDEVLGNKAAHVEGRENQRTDGERCTELGANETLRIAGKREVKVEGDEVHQIGGTTLHVHAGSRATMVGTGSETHADDHLTITGRYRVASLRHMKLESKKLIQLVCGDSKITLHPDRIVMEAPTIQLQAKKRIALVQGDPPQATLTLEGSAALGGGTVSVVAGGKPGAAGKLFLDAEAHLDGALVKLNCGPKGGAGGSVIRADEEVGTARFTVSREGIPPEITTVTLIIATPTGEVVQRECPVGGTVTMEGKKGEVFTLVETRLGKQPVPFHKESGTPDPE